MYKAKLSFGQLCEYVPMLLEQGLLENLTVVKHRQFKQVLKTTEKGQRFLESLRSLELLWLP
jgi:predicted transcriptional regulator